MLFMYDAGDQMVSGTAPANRILFPGGYSTPRYSNLEGLTLLTAAVNAALASLQRDDRASQRIQRDKRRGRLIARVWEGIHEP